MTARELERFVAKLGRNEVRARECVIAAAVCAGLAGATAPLWLPLAVALMAGAGAALLLAVGNVLGRRELLTRLALEPTAYTLPEVRSYGARIVLRAERERLAAWLYEVVREADVPGNWYLADRVARYAGQLELLAGELATSHLRVGPTSAAACKRLLTHATESPLYNPDVPAEELAAAIARIRRGITPY